MASSAGSISGGRSPAFCALRNCTASNSCIASGAAERVFQHIAEPVAVLAELVRVTRPCGWIVLIDTDWASLSIDTEAVELERRIHHFVLDQVLSNGYAGRQLYRLMRQIGLQDVTVEAYTTPITSYAAARRSMQLDVVERAALEAGIIDRAQLEEWNIAIQRLDDENGFYCSVTQIAVAGRVLGSGVRPAG